MARSKGSGRLIPDVSLGALPRYSWLFPGIVGVVLVTTLTFVLVPQVEGIFEDREEIESAKLELEKLTRKIEALESHSELELKERIEVAEFVLPSNKPVFRIVEGVAGLVEANEEILLADYSLAPGSLATESGEQEQRAEPGTLGLLTTEFDMTGDFESMLSLLEQMERFAPIISIQGLSFGSQIDPYEDYAAQESSVSMEVGIHYSLRPEKIGGITSPLPEYEGDFAATEAVLAAFEDFRQEAPQGTLNIDQNRGNPFEY